MHQPDDSSAISFEEGIIGVSRARRFHLLERATSPIRLLRCLDIDGFTLPVVDPRMVDPHYDPPLSPRVAEALGLAQGDPLLLLAVATLDPAGAVANLRAPLVINVNRLVGAQIILDDRSQPLRAKLPNARPTTQGDAPR
jgi:flagellar assembly factor FliW